MLLRWRRDCAVDRSDPGRGYVLAIDRDDTEVGRFDRSLAVMIETDAAGRGKRSAGLFEFDPGSFDLAGDVARKLIEVLR